jgi:hypothetical protein
VDLEVCKLITAAWKEDEETVGTACRKGESPIADNTQKQQSTKVAR